MKEIHHEKTIREAKPLNSVEDFFNVLQEKTWRTNIPQEAERKFSQMIEFLQDNKEEIIEEIIKDVKLAEHMKNEENDEFSYSVFRDWLNYCTKNNIKSWLDEKDE